MSSFILVIYELVFEAGFIICTRVLMSGPLVILCLINGELPRFILVVLILHIHLNSSHLLLITVSNVVQSNVYWLRLSKPTG